ncbi:MAG: rhomboid family intramembrane serine protease, partial [Verrucomicrobia bacterium]|nr:rhomboid family intramembrane serine protease [Verrucomicrobiota bacterium]
MREDYPKPKTSLVTWLVAAVLGSFLLEMVLFSSWFDASNQLLSGLALSISGLADGHVWTFATYWLLHSPKYLFHVGAVLLGLFLLGRELEPVLGTRRFVAVFAGSLILGALFWTAVSWRHGGVLTGATAGVSGLL